MNQLKFVLKSSGLYAALSTAFSVIGLFSIFGDVLPRAYLIGNPLAVSGLSIEHVVGHVVFGLIVGLASLSIRYVVLAGLFPIALDADHLIQFLNLEAVPRMGHSFAYAVISIPIMMYFLGKKDYRLGAISLGSVLSHVSFDVLLAGNIGTTFPLLMPFSNEMIMLIDYDWIYFFISAIIIVAAGTFLAKKPRIDKAKNNSNQ